MASLPDLQLSKFQYAAEASRIMLKMERTSHHPLISVIKESSADEPPPPPALGAAGDGNDLADPLGAMSIDATPPPPHVSSGATNMNFDGMDPLSMMLDDPLGANGGGGMGADGDDGISGVDDRGRAISIEEAATMAAQKFEDELATPWAVKKEQVLRDYQVTSVRVKANFMKDEDNREEEKVLRVIDRTKARLEALEDKGSETPTLDITQKEYISQLTRYHEELQRAWEDGERVLSIKIVIKCTRLLADTSVPQFYPSVFIMVTEILDTFGELVYERILGKAEEDDEGNPPPLIKKGKDKGKRMSRLPPNWTVNDVNVNAKETCRNWFYKISSVRELLPRMYLEMCLLKCYRFLSINEYPQVLGRLASMSRGIGDPLVSVYCQCYLARCGNFVCHTETNYANTMAYDYMFGSKNYKSEDMKERLKRLGITLEEFLHLQSPAVEWIMKCVGRKANKTIFTTALKHYRDYCGNSMVLKHIIDCFDPKHYAPNAAAMVSLVKMADSSKVGMIGVFDTMAARFIQSPPPEGQRLLVLNEVWKVVTKCEDLKQYISCATAWLEVVLHHYSSMELGVLLRDVVKHLNAADADEIESYGFLEPLVKLLVHHCYDFNGMIFKSGELLQILDKFKESRKAEHCKELLDSFAKHSGETDDPVLINTLFEVSRTLHDSIDSLSPEGEQRHCSFLICGFIEKVNYGKDFERQLGTYVDCRAAFCNLDDVKEQLVLCVCKLAMQTLALMRGRHNKKTSAFVKGCLAFNHISIPSIEDRMKRLNLLVTCGWVGLKNQCLPQTDTFLKQAITIIPECQGKVDDMVSWVGSFCGLLVMVPGSPELGPFYLAKGLQKAIGAWSEESGEGAASAMKSLEKKVGKVKCVLSMIGVCSAWGQEKLPYSVYGVDSNDTLYGGTDAYMEELKGIVGGLLGEAVAEIEGLPEGGFKCELLIMLSDVLFVFFGGDTNAKKLIGKLVKKVEGGDVGAKQGKWLARLKRAIQGDQ